MATTFLLDPRVLDDCVSDSAPNVEIEAQGAGVYRFSQRDSIRYVFFQEKKLFLPEYLKGLPHSSERISLGSRKLNYQRAIVYLVPANDGWHSAPERGQPRLLDFSAFYIQDDFLRGNAEAFKLYGLSIKKEDEKNGSEKAESSNQQ